MLWSVPKRLVTQSDIMFRSQQRPQIIHVMAGACIPRRAFNKDNLIVYSHLRHFSTE